MKSEKYVGFYPGLDVVPTANRLGFEYGADCFGPKPELRTLDSVRNSLMDKDCTGPEIVYAIAMDVGKKKDSEQLKTLQLLYGAVTYAAGALGREPVRSQGHIHIRSDFAGGWSTPEVYEIWQGEAIIYMQESGSDHPGRCIAVHGKPGDVIIVPPGWVHATISANPQVPLTFGAWCVRNYGFDYKEVRAHKGIAWFPVLNEDNTIQWLRNENYQPSELQIVLAFDYPQFRIEKSKPIYTQFEEDNERFLFVTRPDLFRDEWLKL